MPLRGTSCAAQRARSKPSNAILPRLRGASPMIARNVVVLPTPLRPSSAADSPAFTSRLTPCRICSLPIWTWTSWRLSICGLLDIILVFRTAEIGLAHLLVGGHLLRAAAGENRTLRQDGDVVGDPEHDLHVVLDDHEVDRAGELANLRDRAFRFGGAHPAGRLIEQQQSRLGNQRHADFEQRHVAV